MADDSGVSQRPSRMLAHSDPSVLRAVATVSVVCLVAAVAWWWTGRAETNTEVVSTVRESVPEAVTESTGLPSDSGTSPFPVPTESPLPEVLVDVRGAVRAPGVQNLPAGARVLDAIRAAGGLRAGKSYGQVNLARVLVDGEQVVVGGARPGAPAVPVGGTTVPGAPIAPLDLNTATAEQLETLNGVGPVLAGEIVAWRTAHGRFTSVDDLLDVSGIGDKTLAGLASGVRVG